MAKEERLMVKAVFEVDIAAKKEMAGTDSIDEALEMEFGWVSESGLSLVYFNILEEEKKESEKCWRKQGCFFNSNSANYHKCTRSEYSALQCKQDNSRHFCLNCGVKVDIDKRQILEDGLGKHVICPWCNSSFDV